MSQSSYLNPEEIREHMGGVGGGTKILENAYNGGIGMKLGGKK